MNEHVDQLEVELEQQQQFIRALVSKISELKKLKRDPAVSDLELGAEIGYIEKMIKDFESDSLAMYHDLLTLIQSFREPPQLNE
jgi:hypothetical protein